MGNKHIFLIILTFALSGCAALAGAHFNYQAKSKTEVTIYLEKHNLDTSNILYIDSASFTKLNEDVFKPNWSKGFRPIQFVMFEKTGKVVAKYASCENRLERTSVLSTFPPNNISPIDTTQRIEYYSQLLKSESKTALDAKKGQSDYTVFAFIGTYTGRYNVKVAQQLQKYLAGYKDENVTLFWVDIDKF